MAGSAQKLKCSCGNPAMGFDCQCAWMKEHPGARQFTCTFCGIYNAALPHCTECEEEEDSQTALPPTPHLDKALAEAQTFAECDSAMDRAIELDSEGSGLMGVCSICQTGGIRVDYFVRPGRSTLVDHNFMDAVDGPLCEGSGESPETVYDPYGTRTDTQEEFDAECRSLNDAY